MRESVSYNFKIKLSLRKKIEIIKTIKLKRA